MLRLVTEEKYLPFSRSWWVPKLGNYYAKLLLQICEGIIWDYLAIMFVFLGRVSFTVGTTFWCRDWVIYCKINLPSRIRVKTASKSLSREWTVGFKWPLALRCLFFTTLSISNQNYNRKARREIFDWAGWYIRIPSRIVSFSEIDTVPLLWLITRKNF